jgi:hypothetical protein
MVLCGAWFAGPALCCLAASLTASLTPPLTKLCSRLAPPQEASTSYACSPDTQRIRAYVQQGGCRCLRVVRVLGRGVQGTASLVEGCVPAHGDTPALPFTAVVKEWHNKRPIDFIIAHHEASALARLGESPYTPTLLGSSRLPSWWRPNEKRPYVIMTCVDGPTLESVVVSAKKGTRKCGW